LILGSLKTSLDGWAGDASKLMKGELTDLANVQSEFAVAQLLGQVPGADDLVRELMVTPQFAQAVVETDPTDLNMVTLSDDLGEKVTGTYSLGAQQGAPITLPNGDSLGKAFRGLSEKSAQKFRLVVQDGLLTGESTPKIVRNLIGRQGGMDFGTGFDMAAGEITKKGVRQIAQAGGPYLTKMANHQIMTLVRTSVNQVSNTASQQTYRANREITDNFIFVATLDSRTSLTCATKDGKEYSYDDGPIPPLHFNCRSTTIAVPNWDALEEKYGIQRPDDDAFRMSKDGPVPAGESYGKWLYDKRLTNDKGKYLGPGPEQIEALGKKKAVYFNRLAARKGSNGDKAIRKLISTDGTEKTLTQIVKENKLRPIAALKERTKPLGLGTQKTKDIDLFYDDYKELGYKNEDVLNETKEAISKWADLDYDEIRAAQSVQAKRAGLALSSYDLNRVKEWKKRGYYKLPEAEKMADLMEGFIKRAPKYDGMVWRGYDLDQSSINSFIDSLSAGKPLRSMSSWTTNAGKAGNFALEGKNLNTGLKVRVLNKRGVPIGSIGRSGENEVLMPKNVRFKVKEVTQRNIGPVWNDKDFIYTEVLLEAL